MKKHRSLSTGGESTEINISPLIDMVFILLIFFIVTAVFVEETGIEVQKPQAASAIDLDKESILIAVTQDEKIFYGGSEISIDSVRALVQRLTGREEFLPVILQVDERASAGFVVRVIDNATLGGASTVSLATER